MNKLTQWLKKRDSVIGLWRMDPVLLHNQNTRLYFKGEETGVYAQIDSNGKLTLGTYEGAIQYITDACFLPCHEEKLESVEDAINRFSELRSDPRFKFLVEENNPNTH